LDCGVHRVRRQVQLTGPGHDAVLDIDLRKDGWISKRGENSGFG